MARRTIVALAVAGATLIAPAAAQASEYLSASEAARVAGRALHKEWKIVPGTGTFNCPATRQPNFRVCYTSYRARGAGCWWTDIAIRELSWGYRYRVLYDVRCH